jgi:ribosomal-protein-alanine N-acetyltransferase
MNTPALLLRLARAADAPVISAMSRDLIETGLPARYTPGRIQRLIRDPQTIALVAQDGTAITGFAIMAFGDEHAHLQLMCVAPASRREGAGTRLIGWLVESAQVAGIASIHLELRADNAGALVFYRKLGFTETVQVPGYYEGQIAARRMVRLLRAPVRQS